MDPDSTLAYMAASIAESIEAYREIAGFDISKNPGLTATLYNIGNFRPPGRSPGSKQTGRRQIAWTKAGASAENYYGWLSQQA